MTTPGRVDPASLAMDLTDEERAAFLPFIRDDLEEDEPSPAALLTAISSWLDASYHGISEEAHLVRRCVKAASEVGEMIDALYGMLGENPRKGVTHTRDDLLRELLDVALAALGAVEHVDGNRGTALDLLAEHIRRVAERAKGHGLVLAGEVTP